MRPTRLATYVMLFSGGVLSFFFFSACRPKQVAETKSLEETVPKEKQVSTIRPGPINYVALGDSTGAGVGAKNGGYVLRLFKRLVQEKPGSKSVNLCVSGATTSDVLRNQLEPSLRADPDLITVGVGINDIGHGFTVEQFAVNFDKILTRLRRATKATIIVTNIPDISSSPRVPIAVRVQSQIIIAEYNHRLEEIAAREGVIVFDVYSVTHDRLADHPEYFSADGFHPSDQGYELWAEAMWPTVARAIGVSSE